MKRTVQILLCLLPLLALGACTNWEQTTFNTLSAAQAGLTAAANDYNTCGAVPIAGCGTIPMTQTNHDLILKAQQAKDLAVNLMITYEEDKAANSASATMTAAENAVIAALSNLSPLVASVEALISPITPPAASLDSASFTDVPLEEPR